MDERKLEHKTETKNEPTDKGAKMECTKETEIRMVYESGDQEFADKSRGRKSENVGGTKESEEMGMILGYGQQDPAHLFKSRPATARGTEQQLETATGREYPSEYCIHHYKLSQLKIKHEEMDISGILMHDFPIEIKEEEEEVEDRMSDFGTNISATRAVSFDSECGLSIDDGSSTSTGREFTGKGRASRVEDASSSGEAGTYSRRGRPAAIGNGSSSGGDGSLPSGGARSSTDRNVSSGSRGCSSSSENCSAGGGGCNGDRGSGGCDGSSLIRRSCTSNIGNGSSSGELVSPSNGNCSSSSESELFETQQKSDRNSTTSNSRDRKQHYMITESQNRETKKFATRGKQFIDKKSLTLHEKTHSEKKLYPCIICERVFNDKSNFNRHKRSHEGLKPYVCEECGQRFTRLKSVSRHHERFHEGIIQGTRNVPAGSVEQHDGQTTCDVCGEAFFEVIQMHRHKKKMHVVTQFKCSICGKEFHLKSGLIAHMKHHEDSKPFKCQVCGRGFTEKRLLTRHMKIHSGVKPYSCFTCKKSFLRSSDVKVHMAIHRRKKEFSCEFCGKAFNASTNHTKHKNICKNRNKLA